MPLIRGRYHATNPAWSAVGQPTNASQSDIALRSNVDYLGYSNQVDQAAALVTTKSTFVPVPVEVGDTFSTITVISGATAASTPTHSQAYLLSGVLTTATLLGTTTDLTTTAVAAGPSARSFVLGSIVSGLLLVFFPRLTFPFFSHLISLTSPRAA